MRKASYTIGYINRYASLRFSITLKNNLNDFCIMTNPERSTMSIRNLYPSLSLEVVSNGWSPDKTAVWSRFTGPRFVAKAKKFLDKFKEITDLYVYKNGELILNKDIANKISFVEVCEFEKRVKAVPVIGKDQETNQVYEGIGFFISNVSNYIIFTYDEFESLVSFLDNFNYDVMALQLLNVAISTEGITELEKGGDVIQPQETQNVTKWVDKPKTIPNL